MERKQLNISIFTLNRIQKNSFSSGILQRMWMFNTTFIYKRRRNTSFLKYQPSVHQRTRFVCSLLTCPMVCASISRDSTEPIRRLWYPDYREVLKGILITMPNCEYKYWILKKWLRIVTISMFFLFSIFPADVSFIDMLLFIILWS